MSVGMDTLATIVVVLAFSAVAGLGLAWATMQIIFQPMKRYSRVPAASTGSAPIQNKT